MAVDIDRNILRLRFNALNVQSLALKPTGSLNHLEDAPINAINNKRFRNLIYMKEAENLLAIIYCAMLRNKPNENPAKVERH